MKNLILSLLATTLVASAAAAIEQTGHQPNTPRQDQDGKADRPGRHSEGDDRTRTSTDAARREFAENANIINRLVQTRSRQIVEIDRLRRQLYQLVRHTALPAAAIRPYPAPTGIASLSDQRAVMTRLVGEVRTADGLLANLREAIRRQTP